MAARTVPVIPAFLAGQKLTAATLNQLAAVQAFWANPPTFSMYQTIAQSLANGVSGQITMDFPEYDSDSGRSGSSPWSYIVPAGMTGRWTITGVVAWSGNASGARVTALYRNGVQIPGALVAVAAAPAASLTTIGLTRTVFANAGDTLACYGQQTSGGALSTSVSSGIPSYFEGRFTSQANP